MSSLADIQARFAAGVLSGSESPLADLADDGRQRARFEVYRNNTHASILEVLADAFPTVQTLLGERLFTRLGTAFIRNAPSRSNHLLDYGADLAGFIAVSEPLADRPWLADVARLDWARNAAYAAADAVPVDPAVLQGLTPEALMELRLALLPSAAVIASDWPVHAIWMNAAAVATDGVQPRREQVLVARPGMQVETLPLHVAEHALLATLDAGGSLGEAALAAQEADPSFDLMTSFAGHLSGGLFTARVP